MITQIDISNFRSIKAQSLPIKKMNILYGANGSGKSSVCYASNVLKNFFVNPNQQLNSLFNLGFINLGSIDNIYQQGSEYKAVSISFGFLWFNRFIDDEVLKNLGEASTLRFGITLTSKKEGFVFYGENGNFKNLHFSMPYSLNDKLTIAYKRGEVNWNGLTFEPVSGNFAKEISIILNSFYERIKNTEIISVRRGFFNAIFSTEQATEESLFAMQIRNEGASFESKIDHYFKQIFNKTFRFVAIPGSTSFYLKTQNSKGHTTDLVNEGFGVNQTVYMLAKLLKKNTSLAFIEEPEIHLHPSAQAKLVDAFTEIIQKENKQIFLSTHSENIVSTVLAKIAAGELDKNDVQFYLAKFEDGETKIIPQEVNDKGQIEGGLMNFMETELANLKTLLGV